jgi:hypothetical protein
MKTNKSTQISYFTYFVHIYRDGRRSWGAPILSGIESNEQVKGGISFKEECAMPHSTICVETSFESLVVEQALAFAREMEATANGAADGKVLDQCELLALSKGRELLRAILMGAAQQQAEALEKKGAPLAPVPVGSRAGIKGARRVLS